MYKKFAFIAVASLFIQAATAASTEDRLLNEIRSKFPGHSISSASKTPVNGVYEIVSGRDVAYTTKDGRYLFMGLIDRKENKDLTALKKLEINRVDFNTLPLDNAIKDVRGDGSRTLVVFSDPDCPHCQRFENEIAGLTNATIYTFPLPVAALHPDAKRKAINVWCAENRVNAWNALVGKGAPSIDAQCGNPIEENIALAEKLGINGTPSLIAKDGRIYPGGMPLNQLEDWLGK
jgi:thiol:disulfide interchange protein DsbC